MNRYRSHNKKPSSLPTVALSILAIVGFSKLKDTEHNTASKSSETPVASTYISSKCPADISGSYDGWTVNQNYEQIIDKSNLSDTQKNFAKFAVIAAWGTLRAGYPINPIILAAQAGNESGWGEHIPAEGNFLGAKAMAGNSQVSSAVTQEELSNGETITTVARFAGFKEDLCDSFLAIGEMEGRLDWYADAVACRFDYKDNLNGLQNKLDPNSCETIGEEPAYASTRKYTRNILDVVNTIDLPSIFIR